jgi:hypothetical protein
MLLHLCNKADERACDHVVHDGFDCLDYLDLVLLYKVFNMCELILEFTSLQTKNYRILELFE